MSLANHSGIHFRGLVYLVDEATAHKAQQAQQARQARQAQQARQGADAGR